MARKLGTCRICCSLRLRSCVGVCTEYTMCNGYNKTSCVSHKLDVKTCSDEVMHAVKCCVYSSNFRLAAAH